ncbi:MAG: tetratricopeptide repeat protein, partial [Actinomycetota bacterium]
ASSCAMAAQDAELAKRRAEEALSLHRGAGDAWGTAMSLFFLGDVAANLGDWDEGRRLFEASVLIFRDVGDEHYGLWASRMLSWMYSELGDFARSGPLHADNLRLARKLDHTHMQAECLEALAFNEIREGRARDAVPFLKEANLIWADLGDTFRLGVSAVRFARVLAAEGLGADAARCMASAELLLDEYGATPPWVEKMKREALTAIEASSDRSGIAEAGDEGRLMAPERVIALALASLETKPSEPV